VPARSTRRTSGASKSARAACSRADHRRTHPAGRGAPGAAGALGGRGPADPAQLEPVEAAARVVTGDAGRSRRRPPSARRRS
jgi:hypothetical protein